MTELLETRRVTTDRGRNKLSKYKYESSKQKCNISEYNVYVGMYIYVSLWYALMCHCGIIDQCGVHIYIDVVCIFILMCHSMWYAYVY